MINHSEIKVFFTKDASLLKKYYDLRHQCYHYENGWSDYDGSENDFDRQGRIVVVTHNDEVVGGMRIMFSTECHYFSNEIPGTQYEYRRFISKYDTRDNLLVSEISALVVDKNYRDASITTRIFDLLFQEAEKMKAHYVCGVAVAIVCRNDRRILSRLKYHLEILINYPWKEKRSYNFTKMFPVYVKLR